MASNQTSNYGLNQWEATDQVLRTEFNADNLKIDTALKTLSSQVADKAAQSTVNSLTQVVCSKANQSQVDELAAQVGHQLLSQASLTEGSEYVKLDLSATDWTKWSMIIVTFQPVLDSGSSFSVSITGTERERELDDYFTSHVRLHLFPGYDPEVTLFGQVWPEAGYDGNYFMGTFPIGQCTGGYFSAFRTTFLTGTIAKAWGVR